MARLGRAVKGVGRGYLADVDRVKQLYLAEDLTQREVAMRLGLDRSTIGRVLKREGIQPKIGKSDLRRIKGMKHPNWKGGIISHEGYTMLRIPKHHRAKTSGYVFEHIVIWEQVHKRKLPAGWVIHHLNGIKNDNRPSNLMAMRRGEHINQTEPFKRKIRELEIENKLLQKALESNQLIFRIEEN